jgi:hypothetical protein
MVLGRSYIQLTFLETEKFKVKGLYLARISLLIVTHEEEQGITYQDGGHIQETVKLAFITDLFLKLVLCPLANQPMQGLIHSPEQSPHDLNS